MSYSLSVYLNTYFFLSKLFFHVAEKVLHISKKSQNPWSKFKKKSLKIIILRAKHFNLYYFLFYLKSIDQKIKELEDLSQNLLTKKVIFWTCVLRRLADYNWHKDRANWGVGQIWEGFFYVRRLTFLTLI